LSLDGWIYGDFEAFKSEVFAGLYEKVNVGQLGFEVLVASKNCKVIK
jgi:hypothetical protein